MDIVTKGPNENILLDMVMRNIGRLSSGDQITAVQSVTPDSSDLTITNVSHSADTVQFRVAGGNVGNVYKINVIVNTQNGDTLEATGHLMVKEV